jgi:hypothetical protein
MPIADIVRYCDLNYNRIGKCVPCENDCRDGCEKCLDAIHLNKIIRRYNCGNITKFYVCKYIYKYSSEIDHLFQINDYFRELPSYNILSIGCGPTTDLYGILNYLQRNRLLRQVNYIGCDLNRIWEPIHVETQNIMGRRNLDVNLQFIYGDIFDNFELINFDVNILILQYVISDMHVHGCSVADFINRLIGWIENNMVGSGYILFNDVNHNVKARDYYDILIQGLRGRNIYVTCDKYYFNNRIRDYVYQYGVMHQDDNLTSIIPREIITRYNPWQFCSSAQLVIKKR